MNNAEKRGGSRGETDLPSTVGTSGKWGQGSFRSCFKTGGGRIKELEMHLFYFQ